MAKEPNSIAVEYQRFAKAVYQGNEHMIPLHQKVQIKQAFYGGAQVMFALINQAAEFDESEAADKMTKFHDELEDFFRMQRQLFEGQTVRIDI